MKERKTFEYQIGERRYQFVCDNDSPLGEVKDALCHFIGHMIDFEKSAIAELTKKQQEEAKQDE